MATRLLVLGLDGVGFDLLTRFNDEGVTPNLAALARDGASGPLRSTIPPITGPSWLALASGLEPDQTGIADFLVREPPLGAMRPISSRDFRGRALWEPIGGAGARVAVFNFPILYPPYDVNGAMVSGFGTDESTSWTWPESLKADLVAAAGGDYTLSVNYHNELYDDADRFLDDLEAALERRLAAAGALFRRERWDLAFAVFSETDWLLHRCWSDLDESHPRHDRARSPAIAERIRRLFARLDAAVPQLLDALGGDASLLVCSDHGFGANTHTVRINLLLEEEGLLVRRPPSARRGAAMRAAGARAAQRAGSLAARVRGPLGGALARARRRARRLLPRDESGYLAATIDAEASVAFDPGHTIPFGGLYLSPRFERGGDEYVAAMSRVEHALVARAAPAGIALEIRRMWLDSTSRLATLPDLVVSGEAWGCSFSKTEFDGATIEPRSFSRRHTGSHRVDGLYLASGHAFRPAAPEPASILDVAPTMLALFGIAAPEDRRGRVLERILAETRELTAAAPIATPPPASRTDDEEADVRDRLKGLGYLE